MTRLTTGVIACVIISAVAWAAASGQVQSVPGPGTGVVTVTGDINVANRPTVQAAQQGEWRMSVTNTVPVAVTNRPEVSIALPEDLKKGGRYDIVWPGGDHELIVVSYVGQTGWVRVERGAAPSGTRWVNLAQARAISEQP